MAPQQSRLVRSSAARSADSELGRGYHLAIALLGAVLGLLNNWIVVEVVHELKGHRYIEAVFGV